MPSIVPHNCALHEYAHAYHKRCDELFAEHALKLARMGFFERRRFRKQLREQAASELKPAASLPGKPARESLLFGGAQVLR